MAARPQYGGGLLGLIVLIVLLLWLTGYFAGGRESGEHTAGATTVSLVLPPLRGDELCLPATRLGDATLRLQPILQIATMLPAARHVHAIRFNRDFLGRGPAFVGIGINGG